jgi:hypothetical protein
LSVVAPPVITFPYGGEASYWHDRADGAWGKYVLPALLRAIAGRLLIPA